MMSEVWSTRPTTRRPGLVRRAPGGGLPPAREIQAKLRARGSSPRSDKVPELFPEWTMRVHGKRLTLRQSLEKCERYHLGVVTYQIKQILKLFSSEMGRRAHTNLVIGISGHNITPGSIIGGKPSIPNRGRLGRCIRAVMIRLQRANDAGQAPVYLEFPGGCWKPCGGSHLRTTQPHYQDFRKHNT